MFDTVSGLPVHALVVHAVVVLLPLMSLVSVAVAVWKPWRRAAKWVVAANAAVVAISFVAKQSGEELQERFGGEIAQDHSEYGELLPWFAVALFAASVVVYFASTRSGAVVAVSIGLVVVCAVAALAWTFLTGDSGARSVWEPRIAGTSSG